MIRKWHAPSPVTFCTRNQPDIKNVLGTIRNLVAASQPSLTGYRALVVGMPNVGKSTLLNGLRAIGVSRGKTAKTGGQPGITRKIATDVKIIEADDERAISAVYLRDTPGIFMPYVSETETMLKLALVGCVKETLIPPILLLDYWLYLVNKKGMSQVYQRFMPDGQATNVVEDLLDGVCQVTGKMKKGGLFDYEAGAKWLLQRFWAGKFGHFMLDDIDADSLKVAEEATPRASLNSAKKKVKEARSQARKGQNASAAAAGGDV